VVTPVGWTEIGDVRLLLADQRDWELELRDFGAASAQKQRPKPTQRHFINVKSTIDESAPSYRVVYTSRGAAADRKMRPTTAPSASTSKSSSRHCPEVREAEARLRIRAIEALRAPAGRRR
jgi:hypothetical protein